MKTNFKATKMSLLRLFKQPGQRAQDRQQAESAPPYWDRSQAENGRFDASDMLPMLQRMVSVRPGATACTVFLCIQMRF